jgi:aryl-alcohol dehydrogenase-like predicted oxidoreductase
VRVSPLCLGTMNFGDELGIDEDASHAVMDYALANGINFFDTADVYGTGAGITEEIIGRWFAKDTSRRDSVILATKVYHSTGARPNDSRLSAVHIRRACEDSLRRLQTDHIDLYQMHRIDRDATWEEIWQAMDVLIQQGKVQYVGSSNHAGWHIAQANDVARSRGLLGLSSEQCYYNLNARMVEMEVLPACQAYGMGVIPYSPLDGGLLGGVVKRSSDGRRARDPDTVRAIEKNRSALEAYEKLCADIGEEPAVVSLAWLLSNPIVTAPIIGPRSAEQIDGALRATEVTLEPDFVAKLDEVFPGPGGPAPEAFG